MNLFESYKEQWQQQTSDQNIDLNKLMLQTKTNLKKQDRKSLLTALFLTISFSIVFGVIGWVWLNVESRSILFYSSLILMTLLLLLTLIGQWLGIQFKKEDAYQSTHIYICDRLKKLTWQRWMLARFTPAYLILLTLFFYLYFADITQGGSLIFIVSTYLGTTTFIVVTYLLSLKKRKRQIEEINALIEDLENWRAMLEIRE